MEDHKPMEARERGHRMLRDSGYKNGGVAEEKAIVRKGIRQHENAEHGGKHEKLTLRRGGMMKGAKPKHRPDRRARGGATRDNDEITAREPDDADGNDEPNSARAMGGRTRSKPAGKGGHGKVQINIVAGGGHPPVPAPGMVPRPPMPSGPPMGASRPMPPAGGAPMGGPPPGAMPPGGMPAGAMARPMPPQMAPGIRAHGGMIRRGAGGRFIGGAV
jgi:hypothetical protein